MRVSPPVLPMQGAGVALLGAAAREGQGLLSHLPQMARGERGRALATMAGADLPLPCSQGWLTHAPANRVSSTMLPR